MRSLTTRMSPPVGDCPVTAAQVFNTVRIVGLIVVVVTAAWFARPGPASGGDRGPAIAVMLGVSAAAWIAWILSDGRDRLMAWSLVVMGERAACSPGCPRNGPVVAVGCVAAFSAGARLSTVASLGVTAETVAAFLATGLVTGLPTAELLGYARSHPRPARPRTGRRRKR